MSNAFETQKLKEYFENQGDVLMAFVFGSFAQGRDVDESDFDVAVYFVPKKEILQDSENEEIYYQRESDIWSDISMITKKEVDLICLNYAPASLVSNVIKTGIPLVIKNRKLHLETYLRSSLEAEDFLRFIEDFYQIKQKAKSLSLEEKERLILRFDYLKGELKESDRFKDLTLEEYSNNRDKRKIVERWAENILNATIDIAKIILASEKKMIPKSYEEALRDFAFLAGLGEKEAQKFSRFANLRNILAHEYLDILYKRINEFVNESPPFYQKILDFIERYIR